MSQTPRPEDFDSGRVDDPAPLPSGDAIDVMLREWHDRERVQAANGRNALFAVLDGVSAAETREAESGSSGARLHVPEHSVLHEHGDRPKARDAGRRRVAMRWVRIGGGVCVLALVASIALVVGRAGRPGLQGRLPDSGRWDTSAAGVPPEVAAGRLNEADLASVPSPMAKMVSSEKEAIENRARKVLSRNLQMIALGDEAKREQNAVQVRSRAAADRRMNQIPVTVTLNTLDAPSVQLLKDHGLSNLVQVGASNTFHADVDEGAILRLVQFEFVVSMADRVELGAAAAGTGAASKSEKGEASGGSPAPAAPGGSPKP